MAFALEFGVLDATRAFSISSCDLVRQVIVRLLLIPRGNPSVDDAILGNVVGKVVWPAVGRDTGGGRDSSCGRFYLRALDVPVFPHHHHRSAQRSRYAQLLLISDIGFPLPSIHAAPPFFTLARNTQSLSGTRTNR